MPGHSFEVVDRRERTVARAVVDDRRRRRRADARQRLELGGGGGVDVRPGRRCGVAAATPGRAAGPPDGTAAGSTSPACGHVDPLTVGERRREVEPVEVGVGVGPPASVTASITRAGGTSS